MKSIEIKRVTTANIQQLKQIARQTFNETFSTSNTATNMAKYLEEGFSAEKLTGELNAPGSEFYFAVSGNSVIGYLKINTGSSQTELEEEKALEIERIYVLKQYHGKKVGQILFEKAIQLAHEKDATYLWLGVWEENSRAINFYQKNGFVEFDKHIFKLGEDEQTDIMMKRKITKDLWHQKI